MIVISAALLFAAIALLVLGVFVVHMLALVYASIIASVIAAVLLGLGAFFQRDEILSRGGATKDGDGATHSGDTPEGGKQAEQRKRSRVLAGGGSPSSAAGSSGSSSSRSATKTTAGSRPADSANPVVPADAVVFVVPGRPYYHLPSCRQLGRREKSELAYAEAGESGYVACRACLPDTALAARAGTRADNAASGDAEARAGDGGTDESGSVTAASTVPPGEVGDETSDASRTDIEEPSAGEPENPEGSGAEQEDSPRAGLVGVVQGSNRYHRLTCAVVEDAVQDGIELTTMSVDEAETEGATRCTVCRP